MFQRRKESVGDQSLAESLKWTFRDACIGAGVSRPVDSPIAGTAHRAPRVTSVRLDPLRFTVQCLPGQLPEELQRAGRYIAPHLGGIALRVTDRGQGWAFVDVLTSDPLADPYSEIPTAGPILVGRNEGGQDVTVPDLPHTLIVGSTGMGKSMAGYSLISQALSRGYRVRGVDPSNTTLRAIPDSICGLGDLDAIDTHLGCLVAEMERRMSELSADADLLPATEENPRILAVLDEYPALLRAVDGTDKKLATKVRGHVSRLLFEARKIGISVLIMAQRPDAQILGGAERAQAGLRIAYRLDGPEAVKMVMPDAVDQAAEHASAPAGVALVASPGRPVTRVRSPFLPYADYVQRVAA